MTPDEKQLLGLMLMSPGLCLVVERILRDAIPCMTKPARVITDAILTAKREHGADDPIAVGAVLLRRGRLAEVGGSSAMLDLLEGVEMIQASPDYPHLIGQIAGKQINRHNPTALIRKIRGGHAT